MPKPAVIVVNSHVVRGSVGGRSAVFALERMGFPVWSLPTVSLAWHPGHGRSTRTVPDDAAFAATVGDLAATPMLAGVAGVLIGYLGSAGQVAPLAGLVKALKAANPLARFLYDPDIGDNGILFVPEATASAARDGLLPLADITTPNRFELGWLAGGAPETQAEIVAAARRLGPAEVVVTSAEQTATTIKTVLVSDDGVVTAAQPAIAAAPKGTGDLFAALYLGHRLSRRSPEEAMRRGASSVARLVARAAASDTDELPLAEGADDLAGDGSDVAIS